MKTQALAQIPETKHAGGPVVRLSDVVKVYKEGDVEVSAIKGITFDIPRQRFSMIVGPSGSGKTTLLNPIGCIDKHPSNFRGRLLPSKKHKAASDRDQKDGSDDRKRKIASHVINPGLERKN